MPHQLDRTPTYRFALLELGPLAKLQVRLAERLIRARPTNLPNSFQRTLAGRTVTVFGFGDLMFYLEVRRPGVVSLYLVVDTKNLPDWFVNPTGDWYEQLDLD